METVEKFLAARRDGRTDDAVAMLAPGATVASIWGYQHGEKAQEFLRDEPAFQRREYLTGPSFLKAVDENTVMRTFHFDKNIFEYTDTWSRMYFPHKYREVYYVKDGQIRLVTCSRQNASLWNFVLFNRWW